MRTRGAIDMHQQPQIQAIKWGRDELGHSRKRTETFQKSGLSTRDLMLTTEQVAAWIGFEVETLRVWRRRGVGPRFVQLSHRDFRYRVSDVNAWLDKAAVETEQPKKRYR
jgi:predicted DNA-binding transcriptional regulator AlpA